MGMLKDLDLVTYMESATPIIEGISKPIDWYSPNSPIQPSSTDLHVGEIYVPGSRKDKPGGEDKALGQYILEPGHTAVILTQERLVLPKDIAGIGFPPARVSSKGILMTNPGHVDPGYVGFMHFTVINMGRINYVLRKGDDICTLLLFQLGGNVAKSWPERHPQKSVSSSIQNTLDILCCDFMDVKNRATGIANRAVKDAELRVKWASFVFPFIGILLSTLIGGFFTIIKPAWKDSVDEIRKNVSVLEERMKVGEVSDKVSLLEQRQKEVEQIVKSISQMTDRRK